MNSVPRHASASEEDRLVFENEMGELLYVDTKRSTRAEVERLLVKGGCRILRRDVYIPLQGFVKDFTDSGEVCPNPRYSS